MEHAPQMVIIQKNPRSGSGWRAHQLQRLTSRLEELGLKPVVYSDREQIGAELSQQSVREQLRCLVAAGGDGTIDDMINRFPGFPLAILAMGTENLLAKHFSSPSDGKQVAEMIAAGHIRKLDLGVAGQLRFAVMASCGFDAEVVERAHAARKGRITKLHYLKPILSTILFHRRIPLKVTSADLPEPMSCEMAVIANLPRYASNLPITPEARDDDGLFSVCLIRKATPLRLIGHSLQGFLLRAIRSKNLFRFETRLLKITAEHPVAVQADGDPVSKTPLEFRVLPQALDLIVPQHLAHTTLAKEYVKITASH